MTRPPAQHGAGHLRRWQERFRNWLTRQRQANRQTVRLDRHRIYIFASRPGAAFLLLLLAMLSGCINYDLSLGYILTFLLGSLFLISLFHTFRNLLDLRISPGRSEATFAGEPARFELIVHNPSPLVRRALRLSYEQATSTLCDIAATGESRVWLSLPTQRRGRIAAPRLTLDTFFPLGWFRAWSYLWFDQQALVYPQPERNPPPLPSEGYASGRGRAQAPGHDDFAGLRAHQAADSPRHIAWKQAARSEALLTKTFEGEAAEALWLDWAQLPGALPQEAKLSRMTAWVLAATELELCYGLRLPDAELPPAQGETQRNRCLAALALCGLGQQEQS